MRTWAVSKIRDRAGNSITFTYYEDTTNGAYRIDQVDYTSNSNAGLSAAYQIDFFWETKPSNEIDSGYVAGSKVKQITRLDRVDVKYGEGVVRRYELTYEGALSSTSKSRLASIQECAGSPLDCLPATTFAYQNGTSGLAGEVNTGQAVPEAAWPLDVNGDGRDDLVYSSSTTSGSGVWMVMLANASGGYDSPASTGVANTNYANAAPIDYNADGRDDLLVPYSGGTWWVMLGSASGLSAPSDTGAPAITAANSARAFDVNGDGLDDLVWAELFGYSGGDAIKYRLREWGGAFSSTAYFLVGPYAVDTRIESGVFGPPGQPFINRVPDMNGDGRGDVLFRTTQRVWDDETQSYRWTFRRMHFVCTGSWGATVTNPNASSTPYFGDFNGDARAMFST